MGFVNASSPFKLSTIGSQENSRAVLVDYIISARGRVDGEGGGKPPKRNKYKKKGSKRGSGILALAQRGFVCGGRKGRPKKSKTRTYLSVDPCITNRDMGD